jgi:predicted lipoprotein with Yx(FWY)xxD motif
MQLKKLGALSATLVVVLAAGCSSSGTSASPAASSAPSSAASSASSPSAPASSSASASSSSSASGDLAVADTKLGKIIVDSKGLTAYYFTKDKANSGKSVCSGDCLVAWPSIPATSDTPTGEGITAKLGSITRDDGSKQVTVNGMPIYLFQKDKAPGDITGQGVGKVWYVVAPDGKMITDAP